MRDAIVKNLRRHIEPTEEEIEIFLIDPGGKEHVLMFAPEDWWCSGDLYSYLSGEKSTNHLEALESTSLI